MDDSRNRESAPNGRADADTSIQWAGNLGRVAGHEGQYSRGVPEPAYFAKEAVGLEGMVLSAELYAPGFSDAAEPNVSTLLAVVHTDLGSPGNTRALALATPQACRRIGNNMRIQWDLGEGVAKAAPGRYEYQFRFSLDGQRWVMMPQQPRHLVVTAHTSDIPAAALVESSVLRKVGEISASRIGWLGAPVLRTGVSPQPQPLPAEATFRAASTPHDRAFLEVAVQVWAPGVSNRADLTPEEHSFALQQLGVRVEGPLFDKGGYPLRFAGKAGIHEHDDIARFNLAHFLDELRAQGKPLPPTGDYPIEIIAGDRRVGVFVLHFIKGA